MENVSITVPISGEGAGILQAVAAQLSGHGKAVAAVKAAAVPVEAAAKGRRGRKPKQEIEDEMLDMGEESEDEAMISSDEDDDMQADMSAYEDDELGLGGESEEDDTPPTVVTPNRRAAAASASAKTAAYKLEDVISAFKAFIESKKGGKDKASKIITRDFGVRSVRDIPANKYAAVIKALKI